MDPSPDVRAVLHVGLAAARRAIWFPLLVFGLHVVALNGSGIYSRYPDLDIPMHLLGGIAMGYLVWVALETAVREAVVREPDRLSRGVAVFAVVSTVAVLWEFAEFGVAFTRGTHLRMTVPDTLLDLLLGMVGGAAFLAVRLRATAP